MMVAILGALAIILAQPHDPRIIVTVDGVREMRTTNVAAVGSPELTVSLRLSGTDTDRLAGILYPPTLEVAQSDDGRDLRLDSNALPRFMTGYREFNHRFQTPIEIELKRASRSATSVTLKGSLRLHAPDPAKAVIEKVPSLVSQSGILVSNTEITNRGLKIVPFTASDFAAATEALQKQRQAGQPLDGVARILADFYGERSGVSGAFTGHAINVLVTDPKKQLLRVRLEDGSGNELPVGSVGMGGVGYPIGGYFEKRAYNFQFQDPPADDTTLVIELFDDSQIIDAPFELVVPLP